MSKSFAILALVGGKSGAAAAAAAAAAAINASIQTCAAHGDMSLLVDTRAAVEGTSARAVVMRAELDRMVAFFKENVMNKGEKADIKSAATLADGFPQAYADAVVAYNAPALSKAKETREANKASSSAASAAAAATAKDAVQAAASEIDALKSAHADALHAMTHDRDLWLAAAERLQEQVKGYSEEIHRLQDLIMAAQNAASIKEVRAMLAA